MFRTKANQAVDRPHSRGFTLVELMVVVAMLAILASLAAPSFADAIRRQRVEGMREEMIASIALAKVEAITRGQDVVLLHTTPCPQAALATDWDCGWTVFVDINSDNALTAGEPVVHEVQGNAGTRIQRNPATGMAQISRLGLTQPARFEVSPVGQGLGVADGLLVCVARSGRVRTVRGALAC